MKAIVERPFWRGLGALPPAVAAALAALDPRPLPTRLAVEVGGRDGDWFVLVSTTTGAATELRPLVGFASRADRVDRLRELGMSFVETVIVVGGGGTRGLTVEVKDPMAVGEAQTWLRVGGVRLDAAGPWRAEVVRYEPWLSSPAPEDPARVLVARPTAARSERRVAAASTGPAAWVELSSLGVVPVPGGAGASWPLTEVAGGTWRLPDPWPEASPPDPDPRPQDLSPPGVVRRPRPPLLATTGYRFTGVDIVGFRIDLSQRRGARQVLQQLVAPLNFHRHQHGRRQGWGLQAFRYQPAAPVLVVELLRYGRMYWGEEAPYPAEPWTAQHELLVRLLVGRVDDQTAQARDPALFVPAIFVDNPWSRWAGRELQGYDKRLAGFHTALGALDLAGCLPGRAQPEPLTAVSSVRSRAAVAAGQPAGEELLGLTLPPGADDPALWVDMDLLMGSDADLGRARWRQSDFADPLFRRGFAGSTLTADPATMDSIQVAPVDGRVLPRAWIPSTMIFDRMVGAQPEGVASLRWPAEAGPPAWRLIASLFPERELNLPTGSWYRARGDLRMVPDDVI